MTNQELKVQDKKEMKEQEPTRAGRTYVPDVDIYETEKDLRLWADMPGVDEKSIDIQLAEGVLTISGEVSVEDYEELTPLYTEYNIGNYFRQFALSKDIDADKIQARMDNGVLEIDLPKAEAAKPRRIPVS